MDKIEVWYETWLPGCTKCRKIVSFLNKKSSGIFWYDCENCPTRYKYGMDEHLKNIVEEFRL